MPPIVFILTVGGIFMSMSPIQSYGYAAQAQNVVAQQGTRISQQKAPEAFEGETKMLRQVYDNYLKNAGGFQEINGQRVHVTTVLHIDPRAQAALLAVENRLRELGELPPLPQPQRPQVIY